MRSILVIDDEELILRLLEKQLTNGGYNVQTFLSPVKALEWLSTNSVELVISDVKMLELSGDEVLTHIKKHHPELGLMFITGHGTINHAVRALQKGAFDYVSKPFSSAEILARVKAFFVSKDEGKVSNFISAPKSNDTDENQKTPKNNGNSSDRYEVKFVGNHLKIEKLLSALPQIANNSAPVFIQGESGTGKEVFASLVHFNSDRANKPYIRINCANLPSELVESTLFGHVKGAFTGAVSDAKGAFAEADGGTLLLDEITEVTTSVQAKLLRVLQEKEFNRVGSQKTNKVDVRIVATTNRIVSEAITEGTLREDLYYRLNVFPIFIPPLRDRKTDIIIVAEYLINKFCSEHNLPSKSIEPALIVYMNEQDWPGNVRELSNFIQRGVLMSGDSTTIGLQDVKNALFTSVDEGIKNDLPQDLPLLPIEEMEMKMIEMALQKTNGNQKEAAKLLGISDRTIRNKLKRN
jgi:DNA-binding NtrC family response regulator